MTKSAWYTPRPDRKIHGVEMLTNEEALARLTSRPGWETRPPVIRRLTTATPAWGEPGYIYPEFADPKEN